jgi:tetratricopeptide (TPR) repeat protein
MRDFHENFLMTARDYAESGMYREALAVLDCCTQEKPMLRYYKGFYLQKLSETEKKACDGSGFAAKAVEEFRKGEEADPFCCFPNKPEDIAVLETAAAALPEGAKAPYYLGCLFYDKLQFDRAISLWEVSLEKDGSFPTVLRNLSIAYYNKRGDAERALECM